VNGGLHFRFCQQIYFIFYTRPILYTRIPFNYSLIIYNYYNITSEDSADTVAVNLGLYGTSLRYQERINKAWTFSKGEGGIPANMYILNSILFHQGGQDLQLFQS